MRTLKGKVKESATQRKERKKEFRENKENVMRVAVPALIITAIIVFLVVYLGTSRPKAF